MSPKLFSLFSLLERNKPQETADDMAIVKAAAWAWYQHGPGSEGKSTSEYDVTRTRGVARPSRYKLEAMRMSMEKAPSIHTNKPLLESYEVQCISRQLNRLMESGHNKLGNGNNSTNNNDGNGRMKNKKRIRKGYCPRHAVVCRGGVDVVGGTALSAKCVPVVNMASCLPRANRAL